jgi:RNA polymerase sigma-70 factor (ECF subfamily)
MRRQRQTLSAAVAISTAGLMVAPSEQGGCDRRLEFEILVARELPRFQRMAMRWLRNREDAEDAVQDAVLSAYKHISSFEGRARMSSWVMAIVINSVRMHLRKAKRSALPLDPALEDGSLTVADTLPDPRPNPEQICQRCEIHGIVTQSILQLSPTQRMSLQLFGLGGLSLKEAADTLGVPLGTVKAQLARGRGRLRKKLRKVLGAGDRPSGIHSGPAPNPSPKPAAPIRASSQPALLWASANTQERQEVIAPSQSLDVVPEDIGFVAMEVEVQSSPVPA